MSLAYYIVLKPEVAGFDPFVDGKALAQANQKALTKLCTALKVRPLEEFISQDPEELADFLEGEDIELPDNLAKEQWFSGADGLKTVRALKDHLAKNPKALKNSAAIIDDLMAYEKVLERVKLAKAKWHLAVDF